MKKSTPVVVLHQNHNTYLFGTVLDCFHLLTALNLCIFLSWFRQDYLFAILFFTTLWIKQQFDVKKKKKHHDGFVSFKPCSISIQKMLTDGLESCGLLWCFYQLFGLSFWRHPFTAEDQLVSKWCNATFLQICSDEETSCIFWVKYFFKKAIMVNP